jgi:5-methylcytosine-specific restriction endonuclease McrA
MNATVRRRTQTIYGHQRKRARLDRQEVDYSIAQLRDLVEEALDSGFCPFCACPLTEEGLSVDHQMPVSRGGRHEFDNLAVVCQRCNEVKGRLTRTEYRALLDLLRQWPPVAGADVLRRLRAGGRAMGERRWGGR